MWRKINRLVFWAGPAVPTFYSTMLSLASGAAAESPKAKQFLNWLVDLAVWVAGTNLRWAATALAILWSVAWFYTDYRADAEERANVSLDALGTKLIETSEAISRLLSLYHAHSTAISQTVEFTPEAFKRTSIAQEGALANLMSAYRTLFDAQVTSLLVEVEERGITIPKGVKSKVERPYNTFGLEDLVRALRTLGDRIKKQW